MEYGGSTPFSTTSIQHSPEDLPLAPPLTTKTGTQAVQNGVEPQIYMEYGGSTPLSTTSVQDSPGSLPLALPLTTKTGTQAVQNGVEPPYSILPALTRRPTTGAALDHQNRNSGSRERRRAAVLHIDSLIRIRQNEGVVRNCSFDLMLIE